jgi:hypothetical protein
LEELLADFGGYALTCRRVNRRDWMQGLAEWLTKVSAALGENHTYEFSGDFISKAKAQSHEPSDSELSVNSVIGLPRRVLEALEAASEALSDLGACDDPACRDDNCNHALTKVRDVLAEQ